MAKKEKGKTLAKALYFSHPIIFYEKKLPSFKRMLAL